MILVARSQSKNLKAEVPMALPEWAVEKAAKVLLESVVTAPPVAPAVAAASPASLAAVAPVTESEVLAVQAAWAAAIKTISKIYLDGGDYIAAAVRACAGRPTGELYGRAH